MNGAPAVLALVVLGLLFGRMESDPSASAYVPCEACHVVEAQVAAQDTATFTHEQHVPVPCEGCHVGTAALNPTDYGWCDRCHHAPQPVDGCVQCHEGGGPPTASWALAFDLPGGDETRPVPFPHLGHEELGCTSCHGDPPGQLEEPFECAGCHEEHHEAERVDCLGCHEGPPTWAHEAVMVHTTCSASLCHSSFDPEDLREAPRAVCEACHTDFRALDAPPPIPDSLRLGEPGVGGLPTRPSV